MKIIFVYAAAYLNEGARLVKLFVKAKRQHLTALTHRDRCWMFMKFTLVPKG